MTGLRAAFLVSLAILLGAASLHAAGEQRPADFGIPETTKMEGTTPAQWRVLWTEDPQTTATVSWSTAAESRANVVHYDTEPRGGDLSKYAKKVEAQRNGRFSGGTTFYHHAKLRDLPPGTPVYFVLESDGKTSKEMHFRTAPDKDVPITIVLGGDCRSGHIIRMFLNFHLVAKLADSDPNALCFAFDGDYVHNGRDFGQWNQWMSHHELTTSPKGRVLPFIPARGNHEAEGPLYDEVFDGAGKPMQNWYALQIGPKIGFVTLNTCTDGLGEQLEFLRKVLPEMNRKNRWIIVQYHVPMYPTAKYKVALGCKPQWTAEFERNGVDLCVEADSHTLKRTHPLRGDKPDSAGVVYVGDGGYGAPPRKPIESPLLAFAKYEKAHFAVLECGAEQMVYKAISIDNQVVDTCIFKPRTR